MDSQNYKMTFARALFDNVAEMPRELSFKKGDILTVLQERYENNPEWWVCSLRNMVGLAPANRLEAMPVLVHNKPRFQSQMSGSMYDELPGQSVVSADSSSYFNIPPTTPTTEETYSAYQLPREDIYVNPRTNSLSKPPKTADEQSIYQIPTEELYSMTVTPCHSNSNTLDDDTVRSLTTTAVTTSAAVNNEYYNNRYDYSDSFSDATSSSFTESSANSAHQFSLTSSDSGDFRSIQRDSSVQLMMSPDDAIAAYRQLQTDTTVSCNKVIEFVKSKWKSEEILRNTVQSLRLSYVEFSDHLSRIIDFATGVYQNSLNCPDLNLTRKLGKHIGPLQESKQTVKDSLDKLGQMNWDPEKMATSIRLSVREGADSLGQVVSAARIVLINIRSLSVTINGNATILFAGCPPTMPGPPDNVSRDRTTVNVPRKSSVDETSVQNVWKLFGQQVQCQVDLVNESVDDFVGLLTAGKQLDETSFQGTVSSNSKFVVRSATQLVCIAKNLSDTKIKSMPCEKIEDAGNRLCDSLKTMINVTKQLIGDRKSTMDQRNQLINQLKSVKTNANNVHRIVVNAVS